ncbi:RNase adapter RapZ [Altererythrobacter sp. BO-6]|uniref:RNase adapter RapZ n=1 Tax=Altererythrobacter sp. BO-6 TaxID=2604537 RepID=UPI0013E10016|nr:RNase adapter RapZ [Altererythrobacter sp. BO-6]QIG53424.1 RNase adapter RapZ [Altererythrobacter sp. BO-6]
MTEARDSATLRQNILLVTGMLGAGKSTALHVLEDLGWEIVDNLPVGLLEHMVAAPGTSTGRLAIGFDSRTRGFVTQDIIDLAERLAKRPDVTVSTIFMDCSTEELERRYNETRRRHQMAQGVPLSEGIRAERDLLEPLRRWAEIVIDTSNFTANDLQQRIRELFAQDAGAPMTVTVSSFGFARGMPPLADLVFDMRFLDNPHWVEELRELTGLDQPVAEHIRKDPGFAESYERILELLVTLLPRYQAQGKGYVHVAFGCTGGKHRSVFTAEQIAQGLREAGFSPTVRHRNLASRTTDEIEGKKR